MENYKVMALITARGGSKGLKDKNILPLYGKSVISWTVEAALNSRLVDRVIISTDSKEIASIAAEAGAEVPFLRPAVLANDTAAHIDVIFHALDYMRDNEGYHPDVLLLLQPTSPLRTELDIDASIELMQTSQCDCVISVCETHHHPLLMNKISTAGYLEYYIPNRPEAGSSKIRRQDLPKAYFENGAIYLTKTEWIREKGCLRAERTRPYFMSPERSMQIDNLSDYRIIEILLKQYMEQKS